MESKDFNPLISMEQKSVPTLIQNVTLFDGFNSHVKLQQDIFIKDGRIEKIGPTGTFRSEHKRIIEGSDLFLMPGLIDSHIHITGSGAIPWKKVKAKINYNLEAYLYGGITTVYDLGGMAGQLRNWLLEKLTGQVSIIRTSLSQ